MNKEVFLFLNDLISFVIYDNFGMYELGLAESWFYLLWLGLWVMQD